MILTIFISYILKEALTPVKKNLTKTNFGKESEEIKELTNFEKVLMECNQERPLKFSEILDKR